MTWLTRTCFYLLLCAGILCLKVKFERGSILYFNPKHVEHAWGNVTRYGRRSDYYINIELVTKYVETNNVTITIRFYEFRWNAYILSIVGFRYKLCDFLEKDSYIGKIVAAPYGLKCPVQPGKYTLMNLTTRLDDFPNVFPFEKGRANVLFNATSTGELLGEGEVYITLKDNFKSKKRV